MKKANTYLYQDNLKQEQLEKLETLKNTNLKTAKAYQLKLTLQEIYENATDRIEAMIILKKWYNWAVRCRLEPIVAFAKTLKNNWAGIINYFDTKLTNAVLEGINSIIQTVRSRARGFRNIENFIAMIYLLAGKLTYNFSSNK